MNYPGFTGGLGRGRVTANTTEVAINLYVENADAGLPLSPKPSPKRPGMEPWIVLPVGPVRAIFSQDGRAFAVAGTQLYELFASQTAKHRGTMTLDNNPATISSNGTGGHQLFITTGGNGYIFDLETNLLSPITDDAFITATKMGAFLDGYFLSLFESDISGNGFQLSDLEDGTSWNGLDVGQTNQTSDKKIALFVNQRRVYIFGSQNMEIWDNTGNPSFPLQPIPGVAVESGLAAPFSIAKLDNTILWLIQDARGRGMVMRAEGLSATRVSTHAVEDYIAKFPKIDDAIAWSFQEGGHAFYVLFFPSYESVELPLGVCSLVYDVSSNTWTEWSLWDARVGRHLPHLGRCHAYGFGKHLVGSRVDGTIYWMRMDRLTDTIVTGPS